jgi:type II restriction/modification system DNA methylase subunit YeeA
MNRAALKTYAPQARKDFIQAISDRAAFYGITADKTEPIKIRGDVVVILGREHSKAVASKRMLLEERIKQIGFAQTIEAIAYSWFNRFVALRYMELHGYLDHGYRVLSHPEGKNFPENLEHAEHLDLPNLDKNTVIDLKLAGNKENELYRLILLAQCNALHQAMPFLFERIDDETELLLPENLLNSDSLIRKLVNGIEEADWDKVEILGWLYQYYISDKKDEVIGSVVASEDIPAATQLFTPNWIVKYLVHNTLGRQWLATYPDSALRTQMEYYIEPAEQEPEVVKQLKEITPPSLNPEEITFLDPACGSGHILVEAYDLFKAIYQERGYRSKDIPVLILKKNLYGFEIDDRAAQLSMFALTMKAREDDRNLFQSQKGESGIQPNILCFVESKDLNPESITAELNANISGIGKGDIPESDIAQLIALFEHAKTFGSLIQIPEEMVSKLPAIEERLRKVEGSGDLSWMGLMRLQPLIEQAKVLSQKYDAVVANPPYMGGKGMNAALKGFAKTHLPDSKSDMFSMFMERCQNFGNDAASLSFVTPYVWMFISSYEAIRTKLLNNATLQSLIQLEYNAFEPACVPVCTFIVCKTHIPNYTGNYIKLSDFKGHENQAPKTLEAIKNPNCGWFYEAKPDDFKKIPGSPIAYWVSDKICSFFAENVSVDKLFIAKKGTFTGDNERFLRLWFEVNFNKTFVSASSKKDAKISLRKWFPYNKGGPYRKWYGNIFYVINWENDGLELLNFKNENGNLRSGIRNPQFYFKAGISWSDVTSGDISFRYYPEGFISDSTGPTAYPILEKDISKGLAFLNGKLISKITSALNPTLHFTTNDFLSLPFPKDFEDSNAKEIVSKLIELAKTDWNNYETSWDFTDNPVIRQKQSILKAAFEQWQKQNRAAIDEMKRLEEKNNRLFIEAYGLQDELSPDVPEEQITLVRADREQDIKRLISYAIGCMMGRYSLDKEGLIYAHSGNLDFKKIFFTTDNTDSPDKKENPESSSSVVKFLPDEDGIVPILNTDWGIADDATNRIVEFVNVCWNGELDASSSVASVLSVVKSSPQLEENLAFIAESLGAATDALPRDFIRKYLSSDFYKNHLQVYKRRPIYWLFSSGKLKAFQCLVYLHRYNEGTLSRMRTEYVIPLLGRLSARIEQLESDKLKSSSTSQRKKLQKEQDDLRKQHTELMTFDEKLKNYADQKIKLDLDDGVKVNYAKFADILAEVKAVTGGSEE